MQVSSSAWLGFTVSTALIRLGVYRPSRLGRNRRSSPKVSTDVPMGRETSIGVRQTVDPRVQRVHERRLPWRVQRVRDPRDTKCDGVRRGALLCRRGGVSVDAGFGDNDGPVAVQELTPSVGIAETYGKWQGRYKPLDCFAHVGVVQHGHYGGIWCGAVLLQHRIGGYQCFFGPLTRRS